MKSEEMGMLLARWKSSGLSLRAFGEREGVGYSKLVYWKRRLAPKAATPEKVELARVSVVPDSKPAAATAISVWLPNGISLEVPLGVSGEELSRLVETLSGC